MRPEPRRAPSTLLCLLALGSLAAGALACEADTGLRRAEDPPDVGFPDPDAGFPDPDAGFPDPDAGFAPDAEPRPDAGFPPMTATEPVYLNSATSLYSWRPDQSSPVKVGDFREGRTMLRNMIDIAIDLSGHLYGGTSDKRVLLIDPDTGTCRFLFESDDSLTGLTFLSDGRLVVAGEHVSIVDALTGRVLRTLATGTQYQTSGDIIGLPDGNLYWTVTGGDGLVRINPSTGATQFLGDIGVDRIFGLGYANGTLYGFTKEGDVLAIDQLDGAAHGQRSLRNAWWGATTNPVLW